MQELADYPRPIHETLEWFEVEGLSLTIEQKLALGRCSNPSAFHDMIEAMADTSNQCIFCNIARLRGTIIFNPPENTWFIFTPPDDFNRHKGALAKKFVIVLKDHTDDPSSLSDQNMIDLLACRRWLQKNHDCFNPEYGGMCYTRFGSTIWNGGTVGRHLHENVDVPNGLDKIRPPVYKDADDWAKENLRYRSFVLAYKHKMTKDEFVNFCKKATV